MIKKTDFINSLDEEMQQKIRVEGLPTGYYELDSQEHVSMTWVKEEKTLYIPFFKQDGNNLHSNVPYIFEKEVAYVKGAALSKMYQLISSSNKRIKILKNKKKGELLAKFETNRLIEYKELIETIMNDLLEEFEA